MNNELKEFFLSQLLFLFPLYNFSFYLYSSKAIISKAKMSTHRLIKKIQRMENHNSSSEGKMQWRAAFEECH